MVAVRSKALRMDRRRLRAFLLTATTKTLPKLPLRPPPPRRTHSSQPTGGTGWPSPMQSGRHMMTAAGNIGQPAAREPPYRAIQTFESIGSSHTKPLAIYKPYVATAAYQGTTHVPSVPKPAKRGSHTAATSAPTQSHVKAAAGNAGQPSVTHQPSRITLTPAVHRAQSAAKHELPELAGPLALSRPAAIPELSEHAEPPLQSAAAKRAVSPPAQLPCSVRQQSTQSVSCKRIGVALETGQSAARDVPARVIRPSLARAMLTGELTAAP